MTRIDKLVDRFLAVPKDFTFDELVSLFNHFGFVAGNKGKTAGSRIEFKNESSGLKYYAHKPHPNNIVKTYVLRQVKEFLTENSLL